MQKEIVLPYNNIYTVISKNTSVIVDKLCNSISFINIGTTLALIDGNIPLNAGVPGTNNGEAFSFGGNKGEIFKGRIDVAFPAGAIGKVVCIQKIYLSQDNLDM